MSSTDTQRRTTTGWLEAVPLDETRNGDGTPKSLRIRGYAIVFNSPSERMGRIIETIDPKALRELEPLNERDVRMQCDHSGTALARTTNGSLRLSVDKRGVMIEADLDPRRSDARDLYYAIERGDVSQMSFGFRIPVNGETLTERADGITLAHVTRIEELYEVSPVNFPAYRATTVEALPAGASDDDEDSDSGEMEAERGGMHAELKRRVLAHRDLLD